MKKTIEMARDAGFFVNENEVYSPSVQYDHELTPYLVRFAELVRAAEREACAKVCDAWQEWGTDGALLAKAIRGNTCTPPQTIEDEHIAKVTSDINSAVYKALAQPPLPVQPEQERYFCQRCLRQKPWAGLTREEQGFVYDSLHNATRKDSFWVDFANAIQARLKEKNT